MKCWVKLLPLSIPLILTHVFPLVLLLALSRFPSLVLHHTQQSYICRQVYSRTVLYHNWSFSCKCHHTSGIAYLTNRERKLYPCSKYSDYFQLHESKLYKIPYHHNHYQQNIFVSNYRVSLYLGVSRFRMVFQDLQLQLFVRQSKKIKYNHQLHRFTK